MKKSKRKSKTHIKCICVICWIVIPISVIALLVLDGLGLYKFTSERLIVLGACAALSLLPFCNEITIKSFTIKKDSENK